MIRAATTRDYPTFATLFRELALEDPVPDRTRWNELASDTLVSERAGTVDGYVTFVALAEAGHVRHLVVSPEARRDGVGQALMHAAARALRERGMSEWHLNVKLANTPAIRLYEKLGMQVAHRSTVVRVDRDRIAELPRRPTTVLPVAPEEDDDIERALGLLAGRIAMTRMRPGRVLVQARDERCAPVAFASFDPALPGAMPFRVAEPALAGTLLDALFPHTTSPWIQLVIEDDPALRDALLAIDADVRLELLHYSGAL